jgi:hypothetical protein
MKCDIDKDEWYPVYVPSFIERYDTQYPGPPPQKYDFTDEEVYIIKNAFLLFASAQEIILDKCENK